MNGDNRGRQADALKSRTAWRVEEAMHRCAAGRCPRHRPRPREFLLGNAFRGAAFAHAGGLGMVEGQGNDPRRQRAGGSNARQHVAGWRQGRLFKVRVRLELAVQVGCRVALQVVSPKPPEARFVTRVVQRAAVVGKSVHAATLLPGRLTDVGAPSAVSMR